MRNVYKESFGAFAAALLCCACSSGNSGENSDNIVKEVIVTEETIDTTDFVPVDDIEEASGEIHGHKYVDLGLPSGLKWATCDLGASEIGQCGDYFAWGEVKPKTPFTEENCETQGKDIEWLQEKGYIDDNGNLTISHDAAHHHWGGSWRLPTLKEIEELVNNTTWEWTVSGTVLGQLLTSKTNGNSIFLPAAGWRDGTDYVSNNASGCYWSSTVCNHSSDDAHYLVLDFENMDCGFGVRYYGRSIRPVSQ